MVTEINQLKGRAFADKWGVPVFWEDGCLGGLRRRGVAEVTRFVQTFGSFLFPLMVISIL